MKTLKYLQSSKASKRSLLKLSIILVISIGLFLPAAAFSAKKINTVSTQTYTVMVGFEQPNEGIGVMSYFPRSITIHEGDTVHWIQNSNEIHTVTFLDGAPLPDLLLPSALVPSADPGISPLVFNPAVAGPVVPPNGEYVGSYANSGIMGREPGQVGEFDLTFPVQGTYSYVCVVHGFAMSGEVIVVSSNEPVPSPEQQSAKGKREMAEALALVPGVVKNAQSQVLPPVLNGDGTMTHTIMIGYSEMAEASYGDVDIDLMQFFPNQLVVRPGDTVTFEMSAYNEAPHTVTFLNGEEEPALAVFQNGFLYFNSEVLFPSGTDVLIRTGIFNSGLMLPIPGTSYSLIIGNMKTGPEPFLCQLHDTSGMKGKLIVVP